MFAYVKFSNLDATQNKKKVFVEDIKFFNPHSYDKMQFYKVKHDCTYIDAQVIFVAETESQLDKLINEKRCCITPTSQMKPAFPTGFDEFLKGTDQHKSSEKQQPIEQKMLENWQPRLEIQKEKNGIKRKSYEDIPIYEEKDDSEIRKIRRTSSLYESVEPDVEILQQPVSSTSSRMTDIVIETTNFPCNHDKEISNLKSQLNIIAEDLEKTQHQLYLKSRKLNDKDRMLREQELKIKYYAEQLNEKEKELVEIRQLNRQLQQNAISNITQLNATVAVTQKPLEIQSYECIDRSPGIGDLRKSDDMVYIGRGKWIPAMTYAMVTNSVKRSSPGKFVKNMTSVMFSREVLLKSTVSGQKSNRDKRNNPVDKLDPLTIQAIKDIFRFWLTKTMRYPPEIVESEVDKTKTYISKKIADLKRARNEEHHNRQFTNVQNSITCVNRTESVTCNANTYYYQNQDVSEYNTNIKMEDNTYESIAQSEESGNISAYGQDVDEDEYHQKVYIINNTANDVQDYKQDDDDLVEVIPNV